MTLADLLKDPQQDIPADEIPALLGEVEQIRAALRLRLDLLNGRNDPVQGDRLLTAQQAAEKLGTTDDYLYRNAETLPFTVHGCPWGRRFSEQEIERYIRRSVGKR